jgi:hypothetical protein
MLEATQRCHRWARLVQIHTHTIHAGQMHNTQRPPNKLTSSDALPAGLSGTQNRPEVDRALIAVLQLVFAAAEHT